MTDKIHREGLRDFIDLEDFFRLNPQLTAAERQEFLCADTDTSDILDRYLTDTYGESGTDGQKTPVTARFLYPNHHFLNHAEFSTWAREHKISYRACFQASRAVPDKDTLFARYVAEHFSSDNFLKAMQGAGALQDFPIPDGTRLSNNAHENFRLFMQYLSDVMEKAGKGTAEEFEQIVAQKPLPLTFEFSKALDAQNHEVQDVVKIHLMATGEQTRLFWRLMDPTLSAPTLPIQISGAFLTVRDKFSIELDIKCREHDWHIPEEKYLIGDARNSSYILLENVSRFVLSLSTEAQKPLKRIEASGNLDSAASYEYEEWSVLGYATIREFCQRNGLILDEKNRPAFEKYLNSEIFLSHYGRGSVKDWLADDLKEFFSFFPHCTLSVGELKVSRSYKTAALEVKNKKGHGGYQVILYGGIFSILRANGYLGAYNYRNSQLTPISIVHSLNYSYQDIIVDAEPLTAEGAENTNPFSEDFQPENVGSVLAMIPHACRHGLVEAMAKKAPWLKAVFDEVGPTANNDVADFVKNWNIAETVLGDSLYAYLPDNEASIAVAKWLFALRRCPHPKLALAFLCYMASLSQEGEIQSFAGSLRAPSNRIISHICRYYLPYLMGQLKIFDPVEVNEASTSRSRPGEETVEVVESVTGLGNVWKFWDDTTLVSAGQNLAKVSEEKIREALAGIENDAETVRVYLHENYFPIADGTRQEPRASFGLSDKKEKPPPSTLPTKKVLAKLRLESTRRKVAALDPLQTGAIDLRDFLNLDLTGAEREDLRQALAKATFGKAGRLAQGANLLRRESERFSSDKSSLEIFSPALLEALLKKGTNVKRDDVWQALFRKSERRGVSLWIKTVKLAVAGKANLTSSSVNKFPCREDLDTGMRLALTSQDRRVTVTLAEYWDDVFSSRGTQGPLYDNPNLQEQALYKLGLSSNIQGIVEAVFNDIPALHERSTAANFALLARLVLSLEKYAQYFGPPSFAELQKLLQDKLPPYFSDYLLQKFCVDGPSGFSNSFSQTVRSIFNLLKETHVDEDSEKILVGWWSVLLTQVWQDIQDSPNLTGDNSFVELYLATVSDSLNMDVLTPVFEDLEDMSPEIEIPYSLFVLAAGLGYEWAFDRLDAAKLFTMVGEKRFFMPRQLWSEINTLVAHGALRFAVFLNQLKKQFGSFASPEEGLTQGIYSGDYEFDWKMSWDLSVLMEAPTSFNLNQKVAKELGDIFRQVDDYQKLDSNFVLIAKNLRRLADDDKLSFELADDRERLKPFIWPEEYLTDALAKLERFDEVNYPQTALDVDRSGIKIDEVPGFQVNIVNHYAGFIAQLQLIQKLKENGFPMKSGSDFLTALPIPESPTPWYSYAVLLARANDGDQAALAELWEYEKGHKKLTSDLTAFQAICAGLLAAGTDILLHQNPDSFFGDSNDFTLSGQTTLAMIEFDHPDPAVGDLEKNLANPQPVTSEADRLNRKHPSMVAQTLLGDWGPENPGSGKVHSYTVKQDQNLWEELNAAFDAILKDVGNGHVVSVVNFSIAMIGGTTLPKEYEQLRESEIFRAVQKKIRDLKKLKIPIVIAAGNAGEGPPVSADSLGMLNFMATLDPSLIVVGATERNKNLMGQIQMQDKASPVKMTKFSSPGNSRIRPDIATTGEDYLFLTHNGAEKDVAGTSFSAPLTARLIAKMKEVSPRLSVETLQAILKMSATDLPKFDPEKEGVGALQAATCLYLAYILGGHRSKNAKEAFAQSLALREPRQNLDWLARRIRWQVFSQNTFRQSYGE